MHMTNLVLHLVNNEETFKHFFVLFFGSITVGSVGQPFVTSAAKDDLLFLQWDLSIK